MAVSTFVRTFADASTHMAVTAKRKIRGLAISTVFSSLCAVVLVHLKVFQLS